MYYVVSLLLLAYAFLIYDTEAAEGNVRLVGGRTPFEGRIEVRKPDGDAWGTVCDDQFGVNDAKVVCRMLGFENTEYATVEQSSKYGAGSGEILFDDTKCQGNESSIFDCDHASSSDCDHTEDVGISCQTPIRLQDSGQVEIKTSINGSWSNLCYSGIDENVGKVMCRMLARSTGSVKVSSVAIGTGAIVQKQWACDGTETDIQNCRPSPKNCASNLGTVLECSTKIRLQGGPNNQSGRVEVFYQGGWGTVCDDSFDDNAASVVCRMLGFSPRQALALGGSTYGEGTGNTIVDELKCIGDETDISDCKSKIWGSPNNCRHTEDAAVECGTLVRLSNGPMAWAGRLEVSSNGIWKAVCDPTFDDNAASVVCAMLGYHGGSPSRRINAYYGQGTGPHFVYNRHCNGNETDIIQCTKDITSHKCNHSNDVGVNCFSETPIRLVGGTTPSSGRVEVYDGNKGLWKGVCNTKYGFTQNDAKVLCTMIGHPNGHPRILDGNHYHYVIRGQGIAHLNCSGTELDISDCRSSEALRSATCDYPDYIGINCDPETTIRLVDGPSKFAGRVEVLFNETWGEVCADSYSKGIYCKSVHNNYASSKVLGGYHKDNVMINDLHCEGNEADISDCKAFPWQTGICTSTEVDAVVCESRVRLVNGSSERSGIVEVLVDDDWRTICADGFDHSAADVVCRMSGFRFWNVSVLAGSLSDRLPYIDNIKCNGTESSLANCTSGPWDNTTCKNNLVATIDCNIWHSTIRLVNGENPYSGRVEVYYNGKWGTVCEKGFSTQNAKVVCMSLGYNFSTDYSVHIDDYDGVYVRNNVMISGMSCNGREEDISLCTSDVWDSGYSNCGSTSYHSVGINCLTQVNLVGGTKYMGRVEVTHQSSRGYICRENFQVEKIPVLCSMMGLNFTNEYQMIDDVFPTSYTRNIIIENLRCTGEEIDIQQCESSTWGFVENCSRTDVVAISCQTPVRLTNGSNIRTGQVEVFTNSRWISMVYQGDSLERLQTGKVICRMLGLSTGSVKTLQLPGNQSNCMNVTCQGHEDDLALCETTFLTSDCKGMSSLGITCDTRISLVYGRTPYMGAVQISLNDRDEYIRNIQNKYAARTVCDSLGYNFSNSVQDKTDFRIMNNCKRNTVERLICNGNETDVMECTNSYRSLSSSGCYYANEGVNCQTPVRLRESFFQHGKVEIQRDDKWYQICSDTFGIEEAHVVCRMLGHYHVENTTTVTYNYTTGDCTRGNFSCNGSEVDISQCSSDWQTTECTDGRTVYVDCRSSIRLVDGPTRYKGRVEVYFNGKWGPICAYNTRTGVNAQVLCKALGFNYNKATALSYPKYSDIAFNASDFAITNLQCVGTEDDVTECKNGDWNLTTCYNNHPLEIECNSDVRFQSGANAHVGRIRIRYNDTYLSVCGDNFTENDATTMCRIVGKETNQSAVVYTGNKYGRTGYAVLPELGCTGLESDVQECHPTPWLKQDSLCNLTNTDVSVNCRPHTPIRLVGTSGLVEMNYNDRWGRICNYGFDMKDATVVCNMLGYKVGKVGLPQNGSMQQTTFITQLRCTGTENDISECSSASTWYYGRSCLGDDNKLATVECSNDRVRLTGGVNDYIGRVKFQFIGIWGTVCDTNFNSNDAEVVCRQVGTGQAKNANIYNASRFGYHSSTLIVDDLKCQGSESDLDECASFPWSTGSSLCSYYNRGAGVNCRPNTPIRLVNGTSKYTGRVEIEYKGTYGTICDREFDLQDAQVVCRSLGYNPWSASFNQHAYYGPGSGNITISHLRCTGDEPDLSECATPYRWGTPYEYCYHGQDVSVQCDTPVRLYGGWTEFDGMVEVFINETWKPVCKNKFTQNDARAICNMKKLWKDYSPSKNVTIMDGSYYGLRNDQNAEAVGNFHCNGTEDDLFVCGNDWIPEVYTDCSTVGINCRPDTPIRLMDHSNVLERPSGKAKMAGRVEIMYKDTWGSICDDQFGEEDALVLCRMLNFTVGKVVHDRTNFGQSKGPILLDDVRCLGIEKDISDCLAREWGTHNCKHGEEVYISCDYPENVDPCIAKQHTWLPNLELRYANVDTTRLANAINDSKLPLRWYNVGNNTMPTKPPLRDHCGTHIPLYSTDSMYEEGKVSNVKVSAVGASGNMLEVQMKHCNSNGQEFYVYRLGPTGNESMGYCFGEGLNESAPTFVPDAVTVVLKTSDNNKNLSFVCKFDPSDEPLFYQVKWTVEENSQVVIYKRYFNKTHLEGLELTNQDLMDNTIGLGVNIFCSVRSFRQPYGQAGPMSATSKPRFVGLQILTPNITLRNGETKAITLEKTFPFICEIPFRCEIKLQYSTPDGNTCSGSLAFKDSCGTTIAQDQQYVHVNISSGETGQFSVGGHFKVYLVADKNVNVKLLQQLQYKLPAINVNILPEKNQEARKKVCSARNDPHMHTFDGKQYEHHEGIGEYILYRHTHYDNVEVQHKISHCTDPSNKAKCNCGVAVRAGRDVYVINVCDRLLDIGYKQCGDHTLTVKKDNDFTYTIYLPYGTGIKVRIDNAPYSGPEGGKIVDISVLPSVKDQDGNSSGLCGRLNDDPNDDFHDRNLTKTSNRIHFISSWRVLEGRSMFSRDVDSMPLAPWLFPSCVCRHDELTNNNYNPLSCDRSETSCTPGITTGHHSCGDVSPRRTTRSLHKRPRIPVVMQTDHYNIKHKLMKREAHTSLNFTMETATKHCEDYFRRLKAFELCNKVPATHTNISVDNCILDILLTGDTLWTKISQQSMKDACMTQIHRNATVRQEIIEKVKNKTEQVEAGNNYQTTIAPAPEVIEIDAIERTIAEIKEVACLNDCSEHGNCSNGTCICEKDYGASDCSLDIKKAPKLSGTLDNGHCDVAKYDCTHIYVFGEVFVGTNLTCRLQKFKMGVGESNKVNTTVHRIPGVADTLIEAMCPVQELNERRRRSTTESTGQPPDDFVHGYKVAISNDGENFSDEAYDVYVYDSTCQNYQNKSGVGVSFSLSPGYCHIDGKCVFYGSLHMTQTLTCDTSKSNYSWTTVPSTTARPTTTTTVTTTTTSVSCLCNNENTKSCVGTKCVCKSGWSGVTCSDDVDECQQLPHICPSDLHKGCQNKPGSYECLCLRGYHDKDGECKALAKNSTTVLTELLKSDPMFQAFHVQITLDIDLDSSHNLETEQVYDDVKTALKLFYTKSLGLGLKDVVILSLRKGSMIVEHSVVVERDDFVMKTLAVAIADMSRDEQIEVFGKEYNIKNIKLGNDSGHGTQDKYHDFMLCESYTSLNPCDEGHTCVVDHDKPKCKELQGKQATSGERSLMITIGSSVGGVLFLVILVLAFVVYRNKKKLKHIKKQRRSHAAPNVYNEMDATELADLQRGNVSSADNSRQGADNEGFENSPVVESKLDKPKVVRDGKFHQSEDGNVYYYGKW